MELPLPAPSLPATTYLPLPSSLPPLISRQLSASDRLLTCHFAPFETPGRLESTPVNLFSKHHYLSVAKRRSDLAAMRIRLPFAGKASRRWPHKHRNVLRNGQNNRLAPLHDCSACSNTDL